MRSFRKASPFEFFLSKKVGKAIADYSMLKDKDRILVGISGGKDSLACLDVLSRRRSFVPIDYTLVAVCINEALSKSYLAKLKKYMDKEGYEFHVIKSDISLRKNKKGDFDCFWCAWNRRKALFNAAEKFHCKKIALGHNKDDIAQTLLMNIFFAGEISIMSPMQEMFKGRLHIIRPMAYVEEKDLARYAKINHLPVCQAKCPNASKNNRQLMKKIIKSVEKVFPNVKSNILGSTKRIRKDYLF